MRNLQYEQAEQKKPENLTTRVARFGLRRALRSFLRPDQPRVMAALVVPANTHIHTYQKAAERMFAKDRTPEEIRDEVMVQSFQDANEMDSWSALRRLRECRWSVLLFTDRTHIPDHVVLAADLVAEMDRPTASHFMAAAREMRLTGMTMENAGFLAGETWERLHYAFRKGRSVNAAVKRLKTPVAAVKPEEPEEVVKRGPRLEELSGYGPAAEWGMELAADIVDYRAGRVEWEDVDHGVLVSGPPGCGKTTFALALGETCGIPVVAASAARWQSKGHLGDLLRAMRAAFKEASDIAPSILFLDEVDSFGDRDGPGDADNMDYKRQVINGLLECMDGAEERKGVVVVGATNYPSKIDAAILRSGRLDRHIEIPLPGKLDRMAILRRYVGDAELGSALEDFASVSNGWSGADIETLARQARRMARRARRPINGSDIRALLPVRVPLGAELARAVAVHECGHALVGLLLLKSDRLVRLRLEDSMFENGSGQSLGGAEFEFDPTAMRTREYYLDRIAMLLGGIAAEEVVLGSFADGAGGSQNADLNLATNLATMVETRWGMGVGFVTETGAGPDRLEQLRSGNMIVWKRVDDLLRGQFERARRLLRVHNSKLETLVGVLEGRRVMTGDEVRAAAGLAGFRRPGGDSGNIEESVSHGIGETAEQGEKQAGRLAIAS